MATRWGICGAGKISHDFCVALRTLSNEDHQVQDNTVNIHIENLLKKLRPKLGFLFRINKCFPFEAKKRIIQNCFSFLCALYACKLKMLDCVYIMLQYYF